MARRIVVRTGKQRHQLLEREAEKEQELQDELLGNPNLIPVEDLRLDGPMLVIGVETTLRSGRADLVGMTPSGEMLVVEFKTGPKNPDFRHALAQLIDYGADLWEMDPAALEAWARRFLAGRSQGPRTIRDAARDLWGGEGTPFDVDEFERGWHGRLEDGAFHFVPVAQEITSNMRSTISYLQETHAPGNFHGVEMVKFQSDDRDVVVAFEGRAVTPPRRRHPRRPSVLGADDVLGEVGDTQHRARLRELLDFCLSLGMTHEVGAVGFSIRIAVADRSEPVSIAWVYPPEVRGWIGLTGLNLGVYDPLMQRLEQTQALEEYVDALEAMPDAPPIPRDKVRGVQLSPDDLAVHQTTVHEALESLANALAETA